MAGITSREMSQKMLDAIANGGSGGTVLIGATTPVEAKDNALWLRTGIGNSESGNIGGGPGEGETIIVTQTIVKNAIVSDHEPDHEVTGEVPFWFDTASR